ncbi:MAG: hypothetical protein QHH30_08520 [candidate division NC10 bacterium]|nr:hypothetical protein [candidate division NC10 bacterium]
MGRTLRRGALLFPFSVILLFQLWATSPAAAADLIENIGGGRINWSQGFLTANGMGIPPREAKNPGQLRAMTQRAAISLARRNLLEVLKGMRVDSSTTVENLIATSDVIKTQVSGIVLGSQVMQAKYFSDGSIEVTVGVRLAGDLSSALMPASLFLPSPAPPSLSPPSQGLEKPAAGMPPVPKEQPPSGEKVTLKETSGPAAAEGSPPSSPAEKEKGKGEVREKVEPPPSPLLEKGEAESAGEKGKAVTLAAPERASELTTPPPPSAAPSRAEEVKGSPQLPLAAAEAEEKRPAVSEERAISGEKAPPAPLLVTGLVVDARGLGLKPALLPRILGEGGGEIYSTRQVSRQGAIEQGLVGYTRDVSAAQRNIRVTDKPLLVKGIRASGKEKTDVIILDTDAAAVVAGTSASHFLEKSRVIIVYD